jgi:hypothetical protein
MISQVEAKKEGFAEVRESGDITPRSISLMGGDHDAIVAIIWVAEAVEY